MKKLVEFIEKLFHYNVVVFLVNCIIDAIICIIAFAINNIWLFFVAVLSNIILTTIIYLIYEKRVKQVQVISDDIAKMSQDLIDFSECKKIKADSDSNIIEVDTLKLNVNRLIDKFANKSQITYFLDGKVMCFDEDPILNIATKESFESQLVDIITKTHYAQSLFALVKLCGGNDSSNIKYLIAKLRTAFPKAVFAIYDDFTISMLLLNAPSKVEIEGSLNYLVSTFSKQVVFPNEDKIDIYYCQVGAVIYPSTLSKDVIKCAHEALEKGESINYYEGTAPIDIPMKKDDTKSFLSNFVRNLFIEYNAISTPVEKFDFLKETLVKTAELFGYNHADLFLIDGKVKKATCYFDRFVGEPGRMFRDDYAFNETLLEDFYNLFDKDGVSFFEDVIDLTPSIKSFFENYEIHSAYQLLIKKNNKIVGWFSLESNRVNVSLDFIDTLVLKYIGQLLNQLIVGYLSENIEKRSLIISNSLIKKSNQYIYMIEKDSYHLTFISDTLKEKFPDAEIGDLCYEKIAKNSKPCEKCPLKEAIVNYNNDTLGNDLTGSILNYFVGPVIEAAILVENQSEKASNTKVSLDNIDPILSIKNVNALYHDVDVAIKNNEKGYIALLDIDSYNNHVELISQAEMDKILIILTNKLQAQGYNDSIYRFNDSMFAFVLHESKRPEALAHIEKIFEVAHESVQTGDYTMTFNYHCAICMYPNDIKDANKIDRVLNTCRDESIALGINCTYIYGEKGGRQSERRKYILDFIDDAIEKNKFEIYIQPIVKADDMKTPIYGEVLLRLKDPQRGFIPPNEFIPVANANERMFGIEMSILNQVGELWKTYGYNIFHQVGVERISVNISSSTINNPEFIGKVIQICKKYKFPKYFLQFEINEMIINNNLDKIVDYIKDLKEYCISWSLDNYGTVGLDINKLIELGFGQIKVDRSFILDIDTNERNRISLSFVTKAALQNNATVVAEGIETKEQLDVCKSLGFTSVQGYYFLKPVAVNDYIKYLNFGK